MPLGCRINKSVSRPDKALVEKFRELPVANVDDCFLRFFAMNARIRPMNRFTKLVGPAYTVKVAEGDNLMLNKAMDLAEEGDVLVVDAFGYNSRAIFGEIIVNFCRKRGLAGIVLDGAIRDADAIAEMSDFPVYAIGVCPNGPYHNGPGTIGYPVSCGGQVVFPGDIIVGDRDGVMAIRPDDASEALALAEAVSRKEALLMRGISAEGVYPRPWVDEKLAELKCDF